MLTGRIILIIASIAALGCLSRDVDHVQAGDAFLEAGRPAAAVREFRAAVALDSSNVDYLVKLAEALIDDERVEEAIRFLREAIRLEPGFWPARYYLGNALMLSGELAGAAVEYEVALDLDPSGARVHVNLGNAYRLLGRYDDARVPGSRRSWHRRRDRPAVLPWRGRACPSGCQRWREGVRR